MLCSGRALNTENKKTYTGIERKTAAKAAAAEL
jgi:hypothetical protein